MHYLYCMVDATNTQVYWLLLASFLLFCYLLFLVNLFENSFQTTSNVDIKAPGSKLWNLVSSPVYSHQSEIIYSGNVVLCVVVTNVYALAEK